MASVNDKMESETQMNVHDLPLEFKVRINCVWSVGLQLNIGTTVHQSHHTNTSFTPNYHQHI